MLENLYKDIKEIKIVDNDEESVNRFLKRGYEILLMKAERVTHYKPITTENNQVRFQSFDKFEVKFILGKRG